MMYYRFAGQAVAGALLLTSGAAFAETKTSADVSANVGVATNPFGANVSGGTASATASGTIAPSIVTTSPTGSLSLGGQVTHTEFMQRYNATTDYSVSAGAQQKLGVVTTLTANAGFSSQIRNGLYPIILPGYLPGSDPSAPILVDPSASATFAERTNVLSGNVGLATSLSPRDMLNFNARGSKVSFPKGSAFSNGFHSYGGGLSYMRVVSANTSVGLSFNAGRDIYDSGLATKSIQYSPSVVLDTRLSPRLTLNANAGMTFIKTDLLFGSINQSAFSGSVGLCYKGNRANYCANASRGVSASAFTGSSTVTSFGANYSYALTPRSNFNANVAYSKASGLQNTQDIDFASAGVSYDRQLGRRLSFVVSAAYNDTYDSFLPRPANFFGSVGLRYRLGDI